MTTTPSNDPSFTSVTIKWSSTWQEFVICSSPLARPRDAWYHTTDIEDAMDTARAMLAHQVEPNIRMDRFTARRWAEFQRLRALRNNEPIK